MPCLSRKRICVFQFRIIGGTHDFSQAYTVQLNHFSKLAILWLHSDSSILLTELIVIIQSSSFWSESLNVISFDLKTLSRDIDIQRLWDLGTHLVRVCTAGPTGFQRQVHSL